MTLSTSLTYKFFFSNTLMLQFLSFSNTFFKFSVGGSTRKHSFIWFKCNQASMGDNIKELALTVKSFVIEAT